MVICVCVGVCLYFYVVHTYEEMMMIYFMLDLSFTW